MRVNDDKSRPAVIVPAFRRPKALRRLLGSLSRAEYPSEGIRVVISLEGGRSEKVAEEAKRFAETFQAGKVQIVDRTKRLGLRDHILWCGDQSHVYKSVVVLEDDLLVDKHYYNYASRALEFYKNDKKIAGIALYAPEWHESTGLPFIPLWNGKSVYFMQTPCSCGQAWTSQQWSEFREWYKEADQTHISKSHTLPTTVRHWPRSSWKKYFAAYQAQCDRFFVYPYRSYSTNYSDAGGEHIVDGTQTHQVCLPSQTRDEETFDFFTFSNEESVYDAFMEPKSTNFYSQLGFRSDELTVDFYGSKSLELLQETKYALTSRKSDRPERVLRPELKPLENAVLIGFRTQISGTLKIVETRALRSNDGHNRGQLLDYLVSVDFANFWVVRMVIRQWVRRIYRGGVRRARTWGGKVG